MKKRVLSIFIGALLFSNSYAEDFNVQVNSLHYATSINEVDYVTKLIEDDPKLASQLNKEGLTPIHLAIKTDSLKSLKAIFNEKINPNIKNSEGETPLVYAIKNNKTKAVKFLLEVSANKNISDNSGHNSIYYAKKSNKEIKNLFFPKEKVVYHESKEQNTNISLDDFNYFKEETNKKLKILLDENKRLNIKLEEDIKRTDDQNKIKISVLHKTIKQLSNDIDLVKLENKDLKIAIEEIEVFKNEAYKKSWKNEMEIKQLKEESQELKRKQLMGIYSSEKNLPEINPIMGLNKESLLVDEESEMELMNVGLEEVEIEAEIIEDSIITDFKK